MLNVRNLIVALALVPSIAACSAGATANALPASPQAAYDPSQPTDAS
jgi:hypothetical protein